MKQMKQLVTAFVLVFVPFFVYSSTTDGCLRSQILPGLQDSSKGSYIADPVLFNNMYNYNYSYENLPAPVWLLDQIIPLYAFTCEENKTWSKSSSFKVPDQVSEIKPIEGVIIRNVTAFDVFDEENKRWTAKQVGLDYDSVKYGFASGSEQSKEKEFVLINNLMIIEASLTVHLYNVTTDKTKFNLSYSYNRYCNMSKANKTLKGYGKIMSNCGTHYFESVILGGRLWFRVFVSIDAYKADPDNMKQLAVNELERYFGINTTQSDKIEFSGEVGREYFQFGSTEQHYHVNDELANYSYWLKHLSEDPYIVGGQMKLISDLAPNQQDNSQFENAIKLKLAGDFISEKINFIDELQSDARHNFRNVLGYFEMFGNSESLKQQIKKWEIPFHGPYYHNSFINATNDELDLVSVKTKKICEFSQIVGDKYPYWPCDHYMYRILDQCIEAVQHKWKSLNALQITEPCCALYDLWNCALQSNCSVCAQDEMDKYQAFMVDAVSKSLCSTVPYHKYDQLCILHDNYNKVDFKLICPAKRTTEPFNSYPTDVTTSSTSKSTWLIALLVLNILLIIVIIGTLLYVGYYYFWIYKPLKALASQNKVEDTKKASEKQVTSSIVQVEQVKSQVKSNLKETKSIEKGQNFPNKISL